MNALKEMSMEEKLASHVEQMRFLVLIKLVATLDCKDA